MLYNDLAGVLALASGMGSSIDTSVPLSERIGVGLELLLVGMGTVFAVLLILLGVLYLFRIIFYDSKNKGTAKPAAPRPEPKPAPAPVPAPAPAQSDDGELIAAITAAVAAYLDAEAQANGLSKCDTRFRVVSFRRAGRR